MVPDRLIPWSRRVACMFSSAVCALACAAAVSATPTAPCGAPGPGGGGSNNQVGKEPPPPCTSTSSAPEMDVSSAVGALTLLLGGLLVVQGTKRREQK
jgi:hypothetical protein